MLLLDEPLGALDLKLRKRLQIELKGIQRDVGITFVYVTHDQEEALTMSDRIAVMNRGVIEQVGGPEEVYERPRTTFVAGFIGVSNLMPGQVESASGRAAELRLDGGADGRAPRRAAAASASAAHAVVRPEKLRVAQAGASRRRPAARASRATVESSRLPGHGDPDRRAASAGRTADDRARPERRRGRAPAAARARARGCGWPGRPSTSTSCARRRAGRRDPQSDRRARRSRPTIARADLARSATTDIERALDELTAAA